VYNLNFDDHALKTYTYIRVYIFTDVTRIYTFLFNTCFLCSMTTRDWMNICKIHNIIGKMTYVIKEHDRWPYNGVYILYILYYIDIFMLKCKSRVRWWTRWRRRFAPDREIYYKYLQLMFSSLWSIFRN